MKKEPDHREQAEILLYNLKETASSKGVTHQVIADKIGWKATNVTRMLNGRYIPRLDNLIKLANAIGVKVSITVQTKKP